MASQTPDYSAQLKGRRADKVSSLLTKTPQQNGHMVFLANDDEGVRLNGGRRGSEFGPQAIFNQIKNLSKRSVMPPLYAHTLHSSPAMESFSSKQAKEQRDIESLLEQGPSVFIHLGGGHDHIYPLLKALAKNERRIKVVNIDAHLDTRTDPLPHSGTPFRQFDREHPGMMELTQLGIHPYANTDSTFTELSTPMRIFNWQKTESMDVVDLFPQINDHDQIVLSLDCDGLDSSVMEAVSAVNHLGISKEKAFALFNHYWNISQNRPSYLGLYEYNPLYDNLSNKGARLLAGLIYPFLLKETR